ncbi:hypothetical protein BC937DRAFT_90418, partial [Endogone sp. FLAS-F59071]
PHVSKLADQDQPRGSLPLHDPPSHGPPLHDAAPRDHVNVTGPQHIHFAQQDAPPEHTAHHADQPSLASSNPPKRPRSATRRHNSSSNIQSDSSSQVIANAGILSSSPKPLLRRATSYQTGDTAEGYFESVVSPPLSPNADAWSEYEVVLDDGTRQRRVVSLSSTVPDQDNDEEEEGEGEEEEEEQHTSERRARDEGTGGGLDFGPDDPEHGTITFAQEHPSSSSSFSLNDYDYDSDDIYSNQSHHRHRHRRRHSSNTPRTLRSIINDSLPHISPTQKLVLKCSIAYFLASLFTFVPQLNALIGNNKLSSHIVATATVFFNPAKTVGGMVEAAGYGWAYTLFAIAVCFGSLATTVWLGQQGLETLARIVSLGVWLGGSTFIVAFLKASWNKPPVATASSLCFIIMFVILVREGSTNMGDFDTTRIEQMALAVVVGTVITVLVCVLVWPSMAGRKLK